MHERYGHIQEVIVQPVVENRRWTDGTPDLETMRRVTAMARVGLPDDVSVQVPPNLAPARDLLDCGVDDLGGVSPVTDDHINPDYAWPALRELEDVADEAGVPLGNACLCTSGSSTRAASGFRKLSTRPSTPTTSTASASGRCWRPERTRPVPERYSTSGVPSAWGPSSGPNGGSSGSIRRRCS